MTNSNGNQVTLWEAVQEKVEMYGCSCPIREGMTKRELIDEVYEFVNPETGRGERRYCTADRSHICPALDYYYRHAPASRQAEAEKRERLESLRDRKREERGPTLPRGKDAVVAEAVRLMQESGGPMKVPDLTRQLLDGGRVQIGGAKKENTVGWYLNKAVKEDGSIRRVAPGVFDAAR